MEEKVLLIEVVLRLENYCLHCCGFEGHTYKAKTVTWRT